MVGIVLEVCYAARLGSGWHDRVNADRSLYSCFQSTDNFALDVLLLFVILVVLWLHVAFGCDDFGKVLEVLLHHVPADFVLVITSIRVTLVAVINARI